MSDDTATAHEEGSGLRMATPDGGSVPISDVLTAPDAPPAPADGDAPPVDEGAATPQPQAAEPNAPPPPPQGYVPVAALSEEREKRRRVEGQASQIAAALQAHPDIVAELERRGRGESPRQMAPREAAPAPSKPGYPVDMLEGIAKDFGLYKADGSGGYDFDAAGRMLGYMDRLSTERAREMVKPLTEARRNDAVTSARSQMLLEAQQNGIDAGAAATVFDAMAQADPELVTHPAVREVINIFTRGLQSQHAGQAPAAAPVATPKPQAQPVGELRIPAMGVTPNFRAPNFTEAGTGRSATPPDIPRLTQRAAKIAGVKISPADFDRAGQALANMGPTGYRFSGNDED